MKFPNVLFPVCTIMLVVSCKTPVQEQKADEADHLHESFIETNRYMRERNRDHIMAFVNRAGWNMNETPTGLWYEIMEKGEGPRVEKEKFVRYIYTTRLITGKICYRADTTAPKKIVVGKGNIEAGLEEGLLLMREGGRARFMIPPYLAHGNFGDGDCIPGSSVLLIDIEIIEVKR